MYIADGPEWDFPIFKILSRNDTGEARGHQGGLVIPKGLRGYFPLLIGEPTESLPTTDHRITAILVVDGMQVDEVDTRYQSQTWGAKRSAETRLTDNLARLRNVARGGDILLIQRNLETEDLYRLSLVRHIDPYAAELQPQLVGPGYGHLSDRAPVTENEIIRATRSLDLVESRPFQLLTPPPRNATRALLIGRKFAFRRRVLTLYDNRCCITGGGLIGPNGKSEIECAHIVPISENGADDPRNGLALTSGLHWAFDEGLFSFSDKMRVVVSNVLPDDARNQPLRELVDRPIIQPRDVNCAPHPDALEWHRVHKLRK